jgi:hypothetical protein
MYRTAKARQNLPPRILARFLLVSQPANGLMAYAEQAAYF